MNQNPAHDAETLPINAPWRFRRLTVGKNGTLGGKRSVLDFFASIGPRNRRKRLTTQPITLFQEYLRNASMLPEVSVHIGPVSAYSLLEVPDFDDILLLEPFPSQYTRKDGLQTFSVACSTPELLEFPSRNSNNDTCGNRHIL